MKRLINSLLEWCAWSWHSHVVSVRFHEGQPSIYRDRPDWFVRDSAHLLNLARNTMPHLSPLLGQANEEWHLRVQAKL